MWAKKVHCTALHSLVYSITFSLGIQLPCELLCTCINEMVSGVSAAVLVTRFVAPKCEQPFPLRIWHPCKVLL